jgi:hypothetical protein
LEGRRTTEALAAGLSASYVLADGAVKSVGRWFLDLGVSEVWMPFTTGAAFFPFLLVAVLMLRLLPPPDEADIAARVRREPMDGPARTRFFRTYAPGLAALMVLHVLLTAYRDFNSNFERELWDALGRGNNPELFAQTKVPITLAVLLALGTLFVIKNNRSAMTAVYGVMLAGSALIGGATFAFQAGMVSGTTWMILVGLGLYLAYVPFGSALFERMIAALGESGNAGFLIYLVDAVGYLGSVGIVLFKDFGKPELSYLDFYVQFSYVTSALCVGCFAFSMVYFRRATAAVAAHQG